MKWTTDLCGSLLQMHYANSLPFCKSLPYVCTDQLKNHCNVVVSENLTITLQCATLVFFESFRWTIFFEFGRKKKVAGNGLLLGPHACQKETWFFSAKCHCTSLPIRDVGIEIRDAILLGLNFDKGLLFLFITLAQTLYSTSQPGPGAAREKFDALTSPIWTLNVTQSFLFRDPFGVPRGRVGRVMLVLRTVPELAGRFVQNLVEMGPAVKRGHGHFCTYRLDFSEAFRV